MANVKCDHAYDNGKNNSNQNIYAYMACMSVNDKLPGKHFGDSSQLTNWVFNSGATCHMTPEVSDFIPSSLLYTDKHIKVKDENHVTA